MELFETLGAARPQPRPRPRAGVLLPGAAAAARPRAGQVQDEVPSSQRDHAQLQHTLTQVTDIRARQWTGNTPKKYSDYLKIFCPGLLPALDPRDPWSQEEGGPGQSGAEPGPRGGARPGPQRRHPHHAPAPARHAPRRGVQYSISSALCQY